MKHKLFFIAFFYLCGIYISKLLGHNYLFLITTGLFIITLVRSIFCLIDDKHAVYICILAFIIGGLRLPFHDSQDKSVLDDYKGETVTIYAEIIDFPEKRALFYQTDAIISSLKVNNTEISILEKAQLRLYDDSVSLSPADLICIDAKVIMPISSENLTNDYSFSLKSEKIYTILSVKSGNMKLVGKAEPNISQRLAVLRKTLSDKAISFLPKEEASFLSAMLLGERSHIEDETYNNFSRSGLSHILAVSGLHLSIMCSIIYTLLDAFNVSKRKSAVFVLIILVFYSMFTGMSASVVRAAIMTAFVLTGSVILRRADSLTSLGFAALFLTVFNPYIAFSLSFMLSFGATLGILLYAKRLDSFIKRHLALICQSKFISSAISTLAVTLSAQVFTLPVVCVYFSYVTLWAPVANLLVLPLLVPLFFGGIIFYLFSHITPLALVSVYFIYPILHLILYIVRFFSKISFGIYEINVSEKTVILYILFVFFLNILLHIRKEEKNEHRKNEKNTCAR